MLMRFQTWHILDMKLLLMTGILLLIMLLTTFSGVVSRSLDNTSDLTLHDSWSPNGTSGARAGRYDGCPRKLFQGKNVCLCKNLAEENPRALDPKSYGRPGIGEVTGLETRNETKLGPQRPRIFDCEIF